MPVENVALKAVEVENAAEYPPLSPVSDNDLGKEFFPILPQVE